MKIVTAQEIAALDQRAIKHHGINSLDLMETAGRLTAQCVQTYLEHNHKTKILVVCGIGNNAGDGFVAARHLLDAGYHVRIAMIGDENLLKEDARTNFDRAYRLNIPMVYLHKFLDALKWADVLIDAIFGFGLNREIQEPFKSIIMGMNGFGHYIFAVDIPSGLDATTGEVLGCCVNANETITFTAAKTGFYKGQGHQYTGNVTVVDIGVPLN